MASFDVQAAKRAGYNDQQINQFMQENSLTPKWTPGGFAQNVGTSAKNFVNNTVSGITNIVNPNMEENTVAGLVKLAQGIVESIIPGEQGNEQTAKALADYFAQRYGGIDNIAQTFYQDPVGLLDDVSIFFTGGGAVASKVGKVSGLSKLADLGGDAMRIGNKIDPLLAPARAIGKVGDVLPTGNIQQKLSTMAESYPKRGYGQPSAVADFEKRFRPINEVVEEYGVYGRDAEKFGSELDKIQGLFDEIASREDRFVTMETLLDKAVKEIDILKSSDIAEEVSAGKKLEQAFTLFMNKNADTLNLKELTGKRKKFDEATKKFADSNLEKGVNQRMREIIQDAIREEAGDILTPSGENITKLGKRLQEGYAFKPIIEKASIRGATSRPFSLGKMATAGVGSVVAGVPGMIGAYALDAVSKTPTVDRAITKGLKKASEVKMPKIPKLPVDKAYPFSKVTRFEERLNNQKKKQEQQIKSKQEVQTQKTTQSMKQQPRKSVTDFSKSYDDYSKNNPFRKIII